MIRFTLNSPLEHLAKWYAETVGYNPIEDDPTMTVEQLRELTVEYLRERFAADGIATPVVTLKNVQYADFASQETACYSATAYVDGKRFCLVSNAGHGGCDEQNPLKGEDYKAHNAKMAELEMRIVGTTSKADMDKAGAGNFWYAADFEQRCAEALTQFLTLRDVKNACGRKVCFRIAGKPGLWTIPGKLTLQVADYLANKYPGCVIINTLLINNPEEAIAWYFDDLPDPRVLVPETDAEKAQRFAANRTAAGVK